MQRLQRIDPLSAAKLLAIVQAALALVFGVAGSTLALFTGTLSFGRAPFTSDGAGVLEALLLDPLVAGLGGYLAGLVLGGVYNWAAARYGGVRISLTTGVGGRSAR